MRAFDRVITARLLKARKVDAFDKRGLKSAKVLTSSYNTARLISCLRVVWSRMAERFAFTARYKFAMVSTSVLFFMNYNMASLLQ